jgi:gamma-glutamyltranspeptidase/glutathione hydrolase
MPTLGSIAAGHPGTAEAAAEILRAGGNAFDAALAALCAACVAEPVLASLGGGGFLLARSLDRPPVLFDFFVQTPRRRRPIDELDFYPILADFGDATQEFHIGRGAIATPGAIAGILAIHEALCELPLATLVAPACRMARAGVTVNPVQRGIAEIVAPILNATPEARALHADPDDPIRLAPVGACLRNPALAETLETLADEGAAPFYRGEWAARLVRDCREGGGHLEMADLSAYRVERRAPLVRPYRGARFYTNPPPSQGGPLLGITLALLEAAGPVPWEGRAEEIDRLARAQALTQRLRTEQASALVESASGLDPSLLADYQAAMTDAALFSRGTTQISVADRAGRLASLTLSNGEGAGYVLPGSGIMMNNMLGESDIHNGGFHRWPTDRRIGSMMAPSLLAMPDGSWVATGSSGSNRIRSAVLQVVCNLLDRGLDLEAAVSAPRIHYEEGLLHIEPPLSDQTRAKIARRWPRIKVWNQPSVFFGGAHSVSLTSDGMTHGAADPRRGGVSLQVE